ncbi:HNH endonuclease [Phormidesmis priestleyi]
MTDKTELNNLGKQGCCQDNITGCCKSQSRIECAKPLEDKSDHDWDFPKVALTDETGSPIRHAVGYFTFPFEVEHIIPVYRGGADAESNLALACRSCNLRKGTRINSKDPESNTEVRLFNPRLDQWNEHFQAEVESSKILGMTSIGRATVICLDFNNQIQLLARQLWSRLDLFP